MLRIGDRQKLDELHQSRFTVIKGMMLMLEFTPQLRIPPCLPVSSVKSAGQLGFSLIELLVSLLVFSVGLLGLASLQVTSLRMAQDAQQNYVASLLASAIANQITSSQTAAGLEFWRQQVSQSLPSGDVQVESDILSHRIKLRWRASEDQISIQDSIYSEYVLDVSR